MSGGHFNYNQWVIESVADQVEDLILTNDSEEVTEWGGIEGRHFTPETIAEFQTGLRKLREAAIYAQRIDWLVSGDDGEESFHRRLKADLAKLKESET